MFRLIPTMPEQLSNRTWFNQSCIMCKQSSPSVICTTCYQDCENVISIPPHQQHPVLIDIQTRASAYNLIVLAWYNWPIDTLIHLIKFRHRQAFCQLISQWFMKFALQQQQLPQAILAMPMGKWKQFTRGYNPAAILAHELCVHLHIDNYSSHLRISSSFISQHHLTRTKRLNRKQKFYCLALPEWITHVAIVDDVVTTGSTMSGAIKAVKRANPSIVISAWSMAATQP